MNNNKIGTKDLINIGIFTAIYFVLFFAAGMIGYIPVFYVFLPFILPIVSGIPFMLFLTKVKTFGMVSIMGTLLGLLMMLTGHNVVPVATGIVFGVSADLIFKMGQYKNKKLSVLGYGVFSMWLLGMLIPFWIMRDSFEKMMLDSMGEAYTQASMALFQQFSWSFPMLAFAGGILGGMLGLRMLSKHFKRAGIA